MAVSGTMGFNIERADKPFVVKSPYKPSGDQPQAIEELATRIENGENDVVLMGATGTGKTATTAWLIERLQRPTLIIEPNKTLAAQLCAEFRELMPDNAVSYFVWLLRLLPAGGVYYRRPTRTSRRTPTSTTMWSGCAIRPPRTCSRGATAWSWPPSPASTASVRRRNTLAVCCSSRKASRLTVIDLLRKFVGMQYKRNDIAFTRGTFRVRGDTVEIIPVYEELAIRIEFFGDEIDRISTLHPLTGDVIDHETSVHIFPASHYVAGPERMEQALKTIKEDLTSAWPNSRSRARSWRRSA